MAIGHFRGSIFKWWKMMRLHLFNLVASIKFSRFIISILDDTPTNILYFIYR